jgi:hypothetical protein
VQKVHAMISLTDNKFHDQGNVLQALCNRLGFKKGVAYDNDWSAAPDFLERIVDHVLKEKPATIVECGCGVTTLMLARCCEFNGIGEVFSLENGAEFAAKTRSEIARYELKSVATIIDAPLKEVMVDGRAYQWYGLDGLAARNIDMLVIDGPSGFIQRHSRYPALPLLFDRLADGCMIYLDDAARQDEREVVKMWQAQFPAIEHEYVNLERGCSILRLQGRKHGP